jgi:N-formylglutamate amidohydrolase
MRGLGEVQGDERDEQAGKKKTMKTNSNTHQNSDAGAQLRSEQSRRQQRKYNLFVGEEIYGFVHASSEAEALDRVAAFKKPFRAVLAAE